MSQAEKFEEPNHHHISTQWWNTYYQVRKGCKNLDAKWKRNHLPKYNELDIPVEYKKQKSPQCTNNPNLKVQTRKLHAFEKHLFLSSYSQEVVTYDQNLFTGYFLFNLFFKNENIEDNIGKINKIDSYSLLIDTFQEMTNHIENHCCLEDIMEVRKFLTKNIIESNNKAASV